MKAVVWGIGVGVRMAWAVGRCGVLEVQYSVVCTGIGVGVVWKGGVVCVESVVWFAGGLQSQRQPDYGRGCGEDCRGAAEQRADFLGVSRSLPRVA